MELTELFEQDLPEGLLEIKNLIGTTATLALVEHYGGRHIKVPSHFHDDTRLGRVVGHRSLVAMIEAYGGSTIYIGKADRAMRAVRNMEISARYEGGTTARELAGLYGLTERQIWNILCTPETLRNAPEQNRLF